MACKTLPLHQNFQSVPSEIAPLPPVPFVDSPVGASRLSTLDALHTIFQNKVLHSSIQHRSPAPSPDASRCHSIPDNEIPSCLLRRAGRSGYVQRRSSSSWCL
jgi:hypothetical protein